MKDISYRVATQKCIVNIRAGLYRECLVNKEYKYTITTFIW